MIYLRLFPWLLSSTGGFLPVFVLSRRLLLFHASLSFFSSLQLYRKLKWPFFFFPFPGRDLSASRSVHPPPPRPGQSGLSEHGGASPPGAPRLSGVAAAAGRPPLTWTRSWKAVFALSSDGVASETKTAEEGQAQPGLGGDRRECLLRSSAAIRIDTHVFLFSLKVATSRASLVPL